MSHWSSLSDFLAMGGYGLFVWGSFGVTFAVLALELLLLRKHQRLARDEVRNWRLLNGETNDTTP